MLTLKIQAESGVLLAEATRVTLELITIPRTLTMPKRTTTLFTAYGNQYSVYKNRQGNLTVTVTKGRK